MLIVTLSYGLNNVYTSKYFGNISPFVLGFYTLLIAVIFSGGVMLVIEPGVGVKIL